MPDEPQRSESADIRQPRQQAWSRYWASGAVHSCVGSFAEDYAGAIRQFWQPILAAVGPDGRMLDIGTGNGPLVKLAVELAKPEPPPRVDAVDLATPAPDWLASLSASTRARLTFHAGVAAEGLPFTDASFDLVVSQFGIEYANLDAAFREAFRVLKPAGRIALVCHHRDSVLHRVAMAESAHLRWMLQESGIFAATHALLPTMARLATAEGAAGVRGDREAEAIRGEFNECMRRLSLRAASETVPDCLHETAQAVMALLSEASLIGVDNARARLLALSEALEDSRLRTTELCAHALGSEQLQALVELAAADGRSLLSRELNDQGRLVGWGIDIGPIRTGEGRYAQSA